MASASRAHEDRAAEAYLKGLMIRHNSVGSRPACPVEFDGGVRIGIANGASSDAAGCEASPRAGAGAGKIGLPET